MLCFRSTQTAAFCCVVIILVIQDRLIMGEGQQLLDSFYIVNNLISKNQKQIS